MDSCYDNFTENLLVESSIFSDLKISKTPRHIFFILISDYPIMFKF